MLEVISVLLLLGIVALVVMSGRRVDVSVLTETEVTRSHLRFVQALAMANNTADWKVRIHRDAYEVLRDDVRSPVPLPGEDAAVHTLPDGITFVAGAGDLAFDRWGAPEMSHVVTLSDGRQARSISIFGFTGLIP